MERTTPIIPESVMQFFREQGRIGGLKGGAEGGRRAAAGMTPDQRRQRAHKAAAASAKVRREKAGQKKGE